MTSASIDQRESRRLIWGEVSNANSITLREFCDPFCLSDVVRHADVGGAGVGTEAAFDAALGMEGLDLFLVHGLVGIHDLDRHEARRAGIDARGAMDARMLALGLALFIDEDRGEARGRDEIVARDGSAHHRAADDKRFDLAVVLVAALLDERPDRGADLDAVVGRFLEPVADDSKVTLGHRAGILGRLVEGDDGRHVP